MKRGRRGSRVACMPGVLALAAAWLLSFACGPDFPTRLLIGSDHDLRHFPSARLRGVLERFRPDRAGTIVGLPPGCYDMDPRSDDDGTDLAMALGVGTDDERVRRYLSASTVAELPRDIPEEFWLYAAARLPDSVDQDTGDDTEEASSTTADASSTPDEAAPRPALRVIEGSFSRTDLLRKLLSLPPEQRRWRSVWAAYRLGRAMQSSDPEAATAWFRRVRDLASEGFVDSLGMAAGSIGWEARAALDQGRMVDAIHLYLEQWATGEESAATSLEWTCSRASEQPEELLALLAADPVTVRVMTAYLACVGNSREVWTTDARWVREDQCTPWVRALEQAGAQEVAGADLAALAAYRAGDFDRAERLAALAEPGTLVAWLRAKLAVHRGDLDGSARWYAAASRGFAPDLDWDWNDRDADGRATAISSERLLEGERGVLMLSRGEYAASLQALLHAGFWEDAAYVADRVLTLDELHAFVDRVSADLSPEQASRIRGEWSERFDRWEPPEPRAMLRCLLARRLARAGRWVEAASYMPPEQGSACLQMSRFAAEAEDASRPDRERATSLWMAARLLRASGLELVATELAPDYAVYEGQYEMGDDLPRRQEEPPAPGLQPTTDEVARAEANAVQPWDRYHYRRVASEMAWRAAAMLPDDDELTARVLWDGGRWLQARDPAAADRFYKALVRRCARTTLGAEAKRLRWFPQPTLRRGDHKVS